MSRAGVKIAGQRFGNLTAIRRTESKSCTAYRWIYRCDCGSEVERIPSAVARSMRQGATPMCEGCRSLNEYVEEGGVAYLDVSTKSHPDAICLIDSSDLDLVLSTGGRWHAAKGPNGILYVTQKNGGYLHRLLMGSTPEEMEIDHISGAGLDNRRENLREVTKSDNRRNTRVSSRNKTGAVGVHKHQGRFAVTAVNQSGQQLWIGSFETIDQAVQARKRAEEEHGYHENHGRVA